MTRGKKSDLYAKSIVLYLRFSDDGKPPRISSSTYAGRRFDNLTHAQRARAGKFHFGRRRRPISSSMLKVSNQLCIHLYYLYFTKFKKQINVGYHNCKNLNTDPLICFSESIMMLFLCVLSLELLLVGTSLSRASPHSSNASVLFIGKCLCAVCKLETGAFCRLLCGSYPVTTYFLTTTTNALFA